MVPVCFSSIRVQKIRKRRVDKNRRWTVESLYLDTCILYTHVYHLYTVGRRGVYECYNNYREFVSHWVIIIIHVGICTNCVRVCCWYCFAYCLVMMTTRENNASLSTMRKSLSILPFAVRRRPFVYSLSMHRLVYKWILFRINIPGVGVGPKNFKRTSTIYWIIFELFVSLCWWKISMNTSDNFGNYPMNIVIGKREKK